MGLLNYTTAKINELLAKVAALPAKVMDGDTKIPSKTSELENDSKFVKETGLKTVNGHSLLGTGNITIEGGSGGGTADSVEWANVNNKPGWVNSPDKPFYTASEVGALPSDTAIPSKTSELENDSKFVKETGLKTINGQSLLGTGNISISGGSGSGEGGGGGNVNVTNAAELKAVRNYVFKPSNDGSTDGTFSALNIATKNEPGLMSTESVEKLGGIKDVYKIPVAVLGLTSASTSDEILAAFGIDPIQENGNLAYMIYLLSSGQSADYDEELPSFFIGNYACSVYAVIVSNTLVMELSYIDQGGKMRTIKISATEGAAGYTYALSVSESGDDTFYLSSAVYSLGLDSTSDDIKSAFGGDEGVESFNNAISLRKNIVIEKRTSSKIGNFYAPTFFSTFVSSAWTFGFDSLEAISGKLKRIIIRYTANKFEIKVFFPNGYPLKSGLLGLTNESTSDEISSAVDGESGLKRIIKAVKDGNQLLLQGFFNELYYSVNLGCNILENDNGDITIVFSGVAYELWGGLPSICSISYTKSDNKFMCSIIS